MPSFVRPVLRSQNPSAPIAALVLTVATIAALAICQAAPGTNLPENLALRAVATATSEYSGDYLARFAVDGVVPDAGSQADIGQAWCVNGAAYGGSAELTLTWPEDVTVAEVIYWGRTAWFAEECWKDYEVYASASAAPVARGQFVRGHGPQPIHLASPVRTRQLRLRFVNSYGGANPGASEIQVFGAPVPDDSLPKFVPLPPGTPAFHPTVQVVEDSGMSAEPRQGRLDINTLAVVMRHEINPSHVYTYHVEGFRPGGGLYAYSVASGRLRELVASPKGEILDCDVSYDGRQILFSWRRDETDGYHVYTVNADGAGLRALTSGHWHDYNACWLPDGGIAFLSTRSPRFAYCWISPIGLLHRMDRNGSNVRRLSANIVNDFTPSVMDDGRLLYSRWEYVDRPAIPTQSLWTIRPDGTGLRGYYGNRVLSPATFMEARSIPGTGKVLCTMTSHNGPARGAIGIIDVNQGDNVQEAIRNLTPEVEIGRVDQGDGNSIHGPYENPFPLDARRFLVSVRGTVLVRDYDDGRQAVVLRPRDGMGFYCPQPLRARAQPPVLTRQRPASAPWATAILQDVYQGLGPTVKRGEVKRICVVEELSKGVRTDVSHRAFGFQFPVISCGATYACKRVWGFAPVSPDGSAQIRIPARRAIYFVALDAQGRAVQRMRTFTHMMPGEVASCVGCHESRATTSLVHRTAAARTHAARLDPPPWSADAGFDYSTVVQPVLDRHCVSCHSGALPAGKVDLTGDRTDYFSVSYEALARGRRDGGLWDNPYTSWIPTYNGMEANILRIAPLTWGSPRSKLADLVLAGHPDGSGRRRVELSDAERQRIFTWIDLNVPYYGTSETAYPDNEGCRRILPADLDRVLADVARRRCSGCHEDRAVRRQVWTRITNPRRNDFLMAPLARAAGGSEACRKTTFASTADRDYQAILRTFEPVTAMLKERPRMDMPGARPAPNVNRSCQ